MWHGLPTDTTALGVGLLTPPLAATLFGWRFCQEQAGLPAEATRNRVVQTSAGKVLVFVCNDAVIFSARSLANLKSDLGLCIRDHFRNELMTEPRPAYILMATHWNGKRGGEAFRTAARHLNDRERPERRDGRLHHAHAEVRSRSDRRTLRIHRTSSG